MNRNKLTKRFLLLSAALTMALGQSAFAGETVALNLDDAMLRAFQTNPTVSIAQYELDSARASYNAARQSRGISISANHTTQRGGYDDAQQAAPGIWTKGIGNNHANSLSASLPIFTGGKLSGTIKQAKANYQYNEVGVQRTYNEMRSTVTDGYFNMLQADNIQKLSAESVTRLEDHLKNVQAQYDVGVVAKVDVLRSQVELANAKQTLIQAENAYQVSEANMNKIVGLPMDTNLKLDNLLVYNAYDKNMDDCLAYAAEHRPELMQAKYNVDAAKGALMVARSGHMPQVAASATQQWSDSSWPGDDNGKWGVGVNVSMNVFDTGVTLSKIHGTNTDVLDAQVALTQAKTNYTKALYDYNTSKTALETSIGVPMSNPATAVKVQAAKTAEAAKTTEEAAK